MLRLRGGMAFRSDQTKRDWEAIALPVDDQQGKADPEKPRVMCTLTAFLGQRVLSAPLGFIAAVTNKMDGPIRGRWQGIERFLDPPLHQQMHMPIARLEQAAKAPRRDLGRSPASQFGQSFVPWEEGLHEDQPTQDEAMTAFPDAGHTTKQDGDEQGQIGDRNHSITTPCKRGR